MTPTRAIALAAVLLLAGCWVLVPELDTGAGSGGSAGDAASGGTGGAVSSGGAGGEGASGGAGGNGGCDPTATSPQSYAEVVLSDCPVAYWRLGDLPCGATNCFAANEVSGSPQGTYQPEFHLGQPGALSTDTDTAVQLVNMGDGHIDVDPPPITLANLAPFSLEIWAMPTLAQNCGLGLITNDGPNTGCDENKYPGGRIILNESCSFEIEMRECGGLRSQIAGDEITESRWYHVVGTFDGTQMRLYIDGVQVDSVMNNPAPVLSEYPFFTIGGRGTSGSFGLFDGLLDEAAVYDYALPYERIQAHFTAAGR